MQSKVTTKPSKEPVSLDELKASLRITHPSEDALLSQFITDARFYAEDYTGRKFITQTITSYYDDAGINGEEWWSGTRVGAITSLTGGETLELRYAPALAIDSIDLINQSNNEALYSADNYYLDNFDDNIKPKIILNSGATISGDLRAKNSIKVIWQAGYGPEASDVPSAIRRGIIILAGELYNSRGDCEAAACSCGVNEMLKQYKFLHA